MASNGDGIRYEYYVSHMQCLRNYTLNHPSLVVLDGCGEFAPGGKEGTPEFFLCDACGCHRNFHKRVQGLRPLPPNTTHSINNDGSVVVALTSQPPPPPLGLVPEMNPQVLERKMRAKISDENKQVLRVFADKIGWTLRKVQDEEEVKRVCSEVGITRQMLKNWINNNRKKMMPAAHADQPHPSTSSVGPTQDQDVIDVPPQN